jgi:hypothetical protein
MGTPCSVVCGIPAWPAQSGKRLIDGMRDLSNPVGNDQR